MINGEGGVFIGVWEYDEYGRVHFGCLGIAIRYCAVIFVAGKIRFM